MSKVECNAVMQSVKPGELPFTGRLIHDLTAIYSCYRDLVQMVEKISASNYSIFKAVIDVQKLAFGEDPCNIKTNVSEMLQKNDSLEILNPGMDVNVNLSVLALLKNCQQTTNSVERSFSLLNKMLRNDRNFLPGNVGKYFILLFNKTLAE